MAINLIMKIVSSNFQMEQVCIHLLIILIGTKLMSCGEPCALNGTVMNCTSKKLLDCPPVNTSIKTLILDDNQLVNLTTDSCLKWLHLHVLTARHNSINSVSDFSTFQSLTSLNVAHNKIGNLNILSNSLETLDASDNTITSVTLFSPLPNLSNYKTIMLGSNQIGNVPDLIKLLHTADIMETLDLSYNKLKSLTPEFMTLKATKLKFLNLAGNLLTYLDFSIFMKELGAGYSLNVSNNLITKWIIDEERKIVGLDFSNNKLSNIDGGTFKYFQGLSHIDLSHNDLDCQCNESASFINWMQQNKDKVIHASDTMCSKPERKPVLDVICTTSSSTSARPTTSSRATSQSTSKFSTVTSSKSAKTSTTASHFTVSTIHNSTPTAAVTNNSWKIAMGFLILIIIIILIVVGYIYLCRRRSGYQQITDLNTQNLLYKCICCPCQTIKFLRNRHDLPVNHEDEHQSVSDDQHLNIEETLCIICSSKDSKWVKRDIAIHLHVRITIIDSKMTQFPYADYILVVVNGRHCLKDSTFIYNVETVLKAKDPSEIRLLINSMPSEESLNKPNSAIEFIKCKVSNKQFYAFNPDNATTCITTLKYWLNLNNTPHNV